MKLGVNIDHIAVLREARRVNDPDILQALFTAIKAGADQITIHLREDRRHINDIDAQNIVSLSHIPVNLECSSSTEIIKIICDLKPNRATLVPEKRAELTTEGGLDLIASSASIKQAITDLKSAGIEVSLFIDPDEAMIRAAKELNADAIELHTGAFANIFLALNSNINHTPHALNELKNLSKSELENRLNSELNRLKTAAKISADLGLKTAAGHGLNYQNVGLIAQIKEIKELNIGQSIIAKSVFSGLNGAIKQMKEAIKNA